MVSPDTATGAAEAVALGAVLGKKLRGLVRVGPAAGGLDERVGLALAEVAVDRVLARAADDRVARDVQGGGEAVAGLAVGGGQLRGLGRVAPGAGGLDEHVRGPLERVRADLVGGRAGHDRVAGDRDRAAEPVGGHAVGGGQPGDRHSLGPARGRPLEHEDLALGVVGADLAAGRAHRERVARQRDGGEGVARDAIRECQLRRLHERVDPDRVGGVAVVDVDAHGAALRGEPRAQRPPARVGRAQPAVAHGAPPAREHEAGPGPARSQVARQRQRQRQRPGSRRRARPHVEALLEPERPVRPPLVHAAVRVRSAVAPRPRRDRPDGALRARATVGGQAQPRPRRPRRDRRPRGGEARAQPLGPAVRPQPDDAVGAVRPPECGRHRALCQRRQGARAVGARVPADRHGRDGGQRHRRRHDRSEDRGQAGVGGGRRGNGGRAGREDAERGEHAQKAIGRLFARP